MKNNTYLENSVKSGSPDLNLTPMPYILSPDAKCRSCLPTPGCPALTLPRYMRRERPQIVEVRRIRLERVGHAGGGSGRGGHNIIYQTDMVCLDTGVASIVL
jgi:hypothetical protein